ncbi:MAG: hypothetical protein LIO56_06640 [Lachnospiraceae bacterium]|nr:hypothetical protein [Lachnospiraceae bacterium]
MATAAIVGSIIGFIIWLLCLIFNVRISRRKNRKRLAAWVVCAVFFSIITLIVNLAVPEKKEE